jgi:diaminopimelate epimerase
VNQRTVFLLSQGWTLLVSGELSIEWAADNHVFLSGPAAFVYDGVLAV